MVIGQGQVVTLTIEIRTLQCVPLTWCRTHIFATIGIAFASYLRNAYSGYKLNQCQYLNQIYNIRTFMCCIFDWNLIHLTKIMNRKTVSVSPVLFENRQ